jgi:hypothetical protein
LIFPVLILAIINPSSHDNSIPSLISALGVAMITLCPPARNSRARS